MSVNPSTATYTVTVGDRTVERLAEIKGIAGGSSWWPDGGLLVVAAGLGQGLGLAGEHQRPIEPLDVPVGFSPESSPDGEWIAFTDGENPGCAA